MKNFIFKTLCKWGFSHLIFPLYFLSSRNEILLRGKKVLLEFLSLQSFIAILFCCRQIWISSLKITLDDSTHYLALEFIVRLRILAHKIFKNNLTARDERLLAFCLIYFEASRRVVEAFQHGKQLNLPTFQFIQLCDIIVIKDIITRHARQKRKSTKFWAISSWLPVSTNFDWYDPIIGETEKWSVHVSNKSEIG